MRYTRTEEDKNKKELKYWIVTTNIFQHMFQYLETGKRRRSIGMTKKKLQLQKTEVIVYSYNDGMDYCTGAHKINIFQIVVCVCVCVCVRVCVCVGGGGVKQQQMGYTKSTISTISSLLGGA